MRNKLKIIMGMVLALGIVSIALLVTPIQAYFNGTGNGDLLRTHERDRLRAEDCDMLNTRTQVRDRLRTQDCYCNCTCDDIQEQNQIRQRTNGRVMNRIRSCEPSFEQYRYQYRNQERMTNVVP